MRIAKPIPPLSEKTKRNFWRKVDSSGGATSCWPWLGRNNFGYGLYAIYSPRAPGDIKRYVKVYMAHRLAYSLCVGYAEPTLEICHQCDNGKCCNPSHLKLGTHSQNLKECYARGRRKAANHHIKKKQMQQHQIQPGAADHGNFTTR